MLLGWHFSAYWVALLWFCDANAIYQRIISHIISLVCHCLRIDIYYLIVAASLDYRVETLGRMQMIFLWRAVGNDV